ncbi:hypothetical protein H2248_005944 [Termitomyces sp. 'cryptogamus']|nr:hypothetical protein H2248_005944 [Termitomyces sp. 'cryptogamus']
MISPTQLHVFIRASQYKVTTPLQEHRNKMNISAIAHRGTKDYNDRRAILRKIANDTLAAIKIGSFVLNDVTHELQSKTEDSKKRTTYYAPDSLLSTWSTSPITLDVATLTEFLILEISTLEAARLLVTPTGTDEKVAILNFASAKKPGGGFLTGAQAQEESIARASTLYPTLMTSQAQNFYTLHNRNPKGGYYSHAMIYSPGVIVFRDDGDEWLEPITVDVVTSPAVNAGVLRKSLWGKASPQATEERIEKVMKERMGRILFLFEQQGAKHIVLGSFGTGVFQNDVTTIARLWAELLTAPNARFKNCFTRVVFGILGNKTFTEFKRAFTD